MGTQTSPSSSTMNGTVFIDEKNDRIVVSPEPNLPISYYGLLPDGTVGLVIAKTGVSVESLFT